MASKVDTSRVKKSFAKAAKDPALAELALAVFKKPLSTGLREELARRQESWPQNSLGWRAKKRRKGQPEKPWERTGATIKAITNNAPVKLGTKKGVKVGMNFRNAVAFASPRSFTNSKGRKLPAGQQDKVFNTLKYGSSLAKLAANAKKRGKSFEDTLSAAFGPGKKTRAMAAKGYRGIPARPLFQWSRSWDAEMERDIDDAVKRILQREGFIVRG